MLRSVAVVVPGLAGIRSAEVVAGADVATAMDLEYKAPISSRWPDAVVPHHTLAL